MRRQFESSRSGAMYLASLEIDLPFARHQLSNAIAAVAVEDFCWRLEYESWRSSRPAWWSLMQLLQWLRAGRRIRADRRRIRELSYRSHLWRA